MGDVAVVVVVVVPPVLLCNHRVPTSDMTLRSKRSSLSSLFSGPETGSTSALSAKTAYPAAAVSSDLARLHKPTAWRNCYLQGWPRPGQAKFAIVPEACRGAEVCLPSAFTSCLRRRVTGSFLLTYEHPLTILQRVCLPCMMHKHDPHPLPPPLCKSKSATLLHSDHGRVYL